MRPIKLSKRVHDSVANNAHQLMVASDQMISNPKERLFFKDQLAKLYELSRNISREVLDFSTDENFVFDLKEMLMRYESEHIQILVNPMSQEFWKDIEPHKKIVVYKILQELMTNMRKHSQADFVEVTIQKQGKKMLIDYTDNGIGMKTHRSNFQNGLRNVENRIKIIKGKITFGKNPTNGTHIKISFPV